jgi:hypothetical protein
LKVEPVCSVSVLRGPTSKLQVVPVRKVPRSPVRHWARMLSLAGLPGSTRPPTVVEGLGGDVPSE